MIAVPVSWVAFRLQGGYFAIGTWVIAEVFRLSFANVSAVGGGSGTSLTALRGIERATRESVTYWMALGCVVAAIALVYLFLRSKQGLALLAIRDNEVAAESQGIAVRRMKLAVYVVAAFGAGLAGALYFVGNLRISPDAAFSVNWTAFAIFMVVIGGIGRIEGPIVGALDLLGAQQVLQRLRQLVPDGARPAGDRRHDLLQARPVGLAAAALRLGAVSHATNAEVEAHAQHRRTHHHRSRDPQLRRLRRSAAARNS